MHEAALCVCTEKNMNNKIFREKKIEELSSPEQLTGYLKVTGPGVWFVLIGIIVLLAGLLIWGTFGQIISTVTVPASVSGGTLSCYILGADLAEADPEVEITIGDVSVEAVTAEAKTLIMTPDDDPHLFASQYLSAGKEVKILTAQTDLADGFYNAKVTSEVIRPISLLFAKH